MMCKVSYVTITILLFAYKMRLKMLYMESILLTLSPCDTTHYDDIKSVHYHREEEKGDLSSGERHYGVPHLVC